MFFPKCFGCFIKTINLISTIQPQPQLNYWTGALTSSITGLVIKRKAKYPFYGETFLYQISKTQLRFSTDHPEHKEIYILCLPKPVQKNISSFSRLYE